MSFLKDVYEITSDHESRQKRTRGSSLYDALMRLVHLDSSDGVAVSEASRKGVVASRLLIEQSLEDAEIAVPSALLLCKIYTAFVITAINVHQSIDRFEEVGSAMSRVSMEGVMAAMGAQIDLGKVMNAVMELDEFEYSEHVTLEGMRDPGELNKLEKFMVSQYYEIEFEATENNNKFERKVGLNVFMLPAVLEYPAIKHILKNGSQEKLFRRLIRAVVGEINPFLDLILCRDLIREQGQVIKQDKNNVLVDYYDDLLKKKRKYATDLLTGRVRNNLANSILCVDEETLKTAAHEANIDFENRSDRKKFMAENFMVMVASLDQAHGLMTIYIAGIDDPVEVGFEKLKSMASGKGGVSPEQLTKILAQGNSPRF